MNHTYDEVWREPAEEGEIYPGFWVHDERKAGSITLGRTRTPLWVVVPDLVYRGWRKTARHYDLSGGNEDNLARFLVDLLEARGEFARLLCTLAQVRRAQDQRFAFDFQGHWPWWEHQPSRDQVREALLNCLQVLNEME